MGESSHHQTTSSRLGGKATVGEIVEVQGGHIVRSTGRKDRHSKVCTAKGPRDRRVRLAAHTAIQFYDVQDRLGYDRPSKAVDWLIKKAKAAIDELAQLPAWHPTACSGPNVSFEAHESQQKLDDDQQLHHQQSDLVNSSKRAVTMAVGEEEDEHHDLHQRGIGNNSNNTQISSFLPPSLDSDVIADTIKSFFPMGASGEATSSSMQFQSFQNSDMMQRSSGHSQDLRLSLQSFQDPIMLHESPNHQAHSQARHVLSGTPLGFDGGSWSEHHQFQRLPPWNTGGGDTASGSGGGAATSAGYYFNSPAAPQPLLQQLLVHNQLFSSQRGPLQSSNTPSLRAWIDPSAVDHGQHHHPGGYPVYPSSVSGAGYGGFTGFHIPARIQGDEEEHDGYSDKPSSASSDSRH